jgi:hypothetical protein
VGVTVRSVTCDGTAANVQALNSLECNISAGDLKSYFKHPSLDVNVYAILDPCHMLKLTRNALLLLQEMLINMCFLDQMETLNGGTL